MNRSKFMMLDLAVFSVLAAIAEFLSGFLFNFFNSGFYISLSFMLTIISMVRWKQFGVIPFIVSGVVGFIMNQYSIMTDQPMSVLDGFLFYVVANAFVIFAIPIYYKNMEEKINTPLKFVLFVLVAFLFLAVGKGIFILAISKELDGFLSYISTSMFTLVISLIFLTMFKQKTDLIVNMDRYIRDLQKEE